MLDGIYYGLRSLHKTYKTYTQDYDIYSIGGCCSTCAGDIGGCCSTCAGDCCSIMQLASLVEGWILIGMDA